MLTEYKAWLFLAKEFRNINNSYYTERGLCYGITLLWSRDIITWNVRLKMYYTLNKCKHVNNNDGYFWPTTSKYAIRRAKLASYFAGSVKRKSNARKMGNTK